LFFLLFEQFIFFLNDAYQLTTTAAATAAAAAAATATT
jgi:hypothetical protein